jgi:hypothetical protein
MVLQNCNGGLQAIDPTSTSTVAHTITVTLTRKAISSPITMHTPTLEWTRTPTRTSEPAQSSTPTPIPPDKVKSWISRQFMGNEDCRLPCWWGIIPGKTSWENAMHLLAPYTTDIRIIYQEDGFTAGFFFDIVPVEVPLGRIYVGLRVRDNIIQVVSVSYIDGVDGFSLSEIMETYGKPSEIYIDATHPLAYSTDPRPISVHIYYPIQGIFAAYSSPLGTKKDGMQQGCQEYGPGLTLFPPGEQRNYGEFTQGLGLGFLFPFRPVTEALGIDELTFYNMYKGIDKEVCLETPINIWVWGDPTPTP